MKRIFLQITIIFAFLFVGIAANSKTLVLVNYDSTAYGAPDEALISAHAKLFNNSIVNVEVETFIKFIKKTEGHTYSICDPMGCGPEENSDSKREAFTLSGGTNTGNYLNLYLNPNEKPGVSVLNVKYQVKNNPEEFADFTCTYYVGVTGIKEIFFNSSEIEANLEEDGSIINFKLNNEFLNSNLYLIDINGNIISNTIINQSEIKIELSKLSAGTYFYKIISPYKIISNKFIIFK